MSANETAERIFRLVCDWFGVTREDVLSRCRRRVLVDARMVFCYSVRHHTNLPLAEIGRRIGRTHADVMHHVANGAEWERDRKLNPTCHDAIAQVASTL